MLDILPSVGRRTLRTLGFLVFLLAQSPWSRQFVPPGAFTGISSSVISWSLSDPETRAGEVARLDDEVSPTLGNRRRFSIGSSKAVIRWVKGNGLDDNVTTTAIAMATLDSFEVRWTMS